MNLTPLPETGNSPAIFSIFFKGYVINDIIASHKTPGNSFLVTRWEDNNVAHDDCLEQQSTEYGLER
jgi:hypothetical protein